MPSGRCSCAGSSCGCLVIGGPGAQVTGSGNAADPYVLSVVTNYEDLGVNTTPGFVYAIPDLGGDSMYYVEVEDPTNIKLPGTATLGSTLTLFINATVAGSTISWNTNGGVVRWAGGAAPAVGTAVGVFRVEFVHYNYDVGSPFWAARLVATY